VAGCADHTQPQEIFMDAFATPQDALARKNNAYLEALTASTKIWSDGFQAIAKTMADMAHSQLNASVTACNALASIKSMPEAIEVQTDHVKKCCSTAIADFSTLTATTIKLSEAAMAPLKHQIAA